jgi:hypothetical protein
MKFKNSDPYEEMDRSPCEEHPVDIAARERIPQALTDNIKLATGKLLDALGGDISSWLWLESLINEYRCRRDKVLFNIGHEYGYLAGCTHTLARKRRQSGSPACRKLAQQVHKQLTLSGLSPKRCIAILLDTASAILEESAAN